jgi:hypothetical protein
VNGGLFLFADFDATVPELTAGAGMPITEAEVYML